MTIETMPVLIVTTTCLACAISDIRTFRVANAWTLPLLATGLLFHLAVGGWSGLGRSAAGAGFGFLVLIVPYALGGMGAGDVKLLAGVGAWLGMPVTYHVLIAAALFCGAYAVILTIMTGRIRETISEVVAMIQGIPRPARLPVQVVVEGANRHRRVIPFAAMITLGLVSTLVTS